MSDIPVSETSVARLATIRPSRLVRVADHSGTGVTTLYLRHLSNELTPGEDLELQ